MKKKKKKKQHNERHMHAWFTRGFAFNNHLRFLAFPPGDVITMFLARCALIRTRSRFVSFCFASCTVNPRDNASVVILQTTCSGMRNCLRLLSHGTLITPLTIHCINTLPLKLEKRHERFLICTDDISVNCRLLFLFYFFFFLMVHSV